MFGLTGTAHLCQWNLAQQAERRRIIDSLNAEVTNAVSGRYICVGYSMRTLRLITSLNEPGMADALYQWTIKSHTPADEDEIRELIAFGVPYREAIGKRMLMFVINRTKISHPRFVYSDLSEMDDEDAAAFRKVLSVLISIYRQHRTSRWQGMEDEDWNHQYVPAWEEAYKLFPVVSKGLVDLIMAYPHRSEEIVSHVVNRGIGIDITSFDASGLRLFLESGSAALSDGTL